MYTMEIVAANAAGDVRSERWDGRDYWVAPMTIIVPGVLNGSKGPLLYPEDEVKKHPGLWNHLPIVNGHPKEGGVYVSARSPSIIEKFGLGFTFNDRFENSKRLVDAWLDKAKVAALPTLESAIRNKRAVEQSTGLFTEDTAQTGTFNSVDYTHIARNYRPDHVAILLDSIGACSVRDGCGLGVNSSWHGRFWEWLKEQFGLTPEELLANAQINQPRSGNTGQYKPPGSGTGVGDTHASAQYGNAVLTEDDATKGAEAKAAAELGVNPPSWVTDEIAWEKAKDAASKQDAEDPWALTAYIYKRMTNNSNPEGCNQYKSCGSGAAEAGKEASKAGVNVGKAGHAGGMQTSGDAGKQSAKAGKATEKANDVASHLKAAEAHSLASGLHGVAAAAHERDSTSGAAAHRAAADSHQAASMAHYKEVATNHGPEGKAAVAKLASAGIVGAKHELEIYGKSSNPMAKSFAEGSKARLGRYQELHKLATNREISVDKKGKVDYLVANCKCWEESDRAMLSNLGESKLDDLILQSKTQAAREVAVNAATMDECKKMMETETAKTNAKLDQLIAGLDAPRRNAAVAKLTANTKPDAKEALVKRLMAMSIDDLELLAANHTVPTETPTGVRPAFIGVNGAGGASDAVDKDATLEFEPTFSNEELIAHRATLQPKKVA